MQGVEKYDLTGHNIFVLKHASIMHNSVETEMHNKTMHDSVETETYNIANQRQKYQNIMSLGIHKYTQRRNIIICDFPHACRVTPPRASVRQARNLRFKKRIKSEDFVVLLKYNMLIRPIYSSINKHLRPNYTIS